MARLLAEQQQYQDKYYFFRKNLQHVANLTLMTNNDPEFSNDLFKACKANSIIKKPFRFSHLLEKIHSKDLVK